MERSFWSTIRGKLLSRTLLVVLLPMLILGGAAVYALLSLSDTADASVAEARETLSNDVVGARVAGTSDQIGREIAIFLDERMSDVEGWSNNGQFILAAKAAAARANLDGLVDMPIDTVETMFFDNPRLGNPGVERALQGAVDGIPAFKEIFITDVNGFNVEYSNKTSDFVQSDEAWWIEAMEAGLHISEPEFDPSAGVFAVDISIRLEDPDTNEPAGVLKAVLDVAGVQTLADRFVGTSDEFQVAILDSDGRFLAETASGHEPTHIMNAAYVAADAVFANARVAEAVAGNAAELHPNGFSIDAEAVGGYSEVDQQLVELRGDMDTNLRAFGWTVIVEQPSDVAFAALAPLESLATQVSDTSSSLTILLGLIGLAGLVLAAFVALVFGRRLASPITRLRDAAVEAAEVTLPNVVAQIDELDEDEELPAIPQLVLDTGDEVEDLANSFNTVQQTAANLAIEQARMRRKNVATTFVNLGRRNQNLLARQLEHINAMESTETNSQQLQSLFQLDHLATRMRRNAESLLVLAGEETPRRFRQPVSMHQLLQAAGAEIEDYSRIEFGTVDDAAVEGGVASDIAHLLAELLENASAFSPPNTTIQVHGRRRANGYALAIVDQGIGMQGPELSSANARLADPAEFDRAPSAYLGHFVVGHLAKRHRIQVQLSESPSGGITAQLHLPQELVVAQPAAFPASDRLAEASADTHVATSDNDTARELAEIAALEASVNAPSAPAAEPMSQPLLDPLEEPTHVDHVAAPVEPSHFADVVSGIEAEPVPEPLPVPEAVVPVTPEPEPIHVEPAPVVPEPVAAAPAAPAPIAEGPASPAPIAPAPTTEPLPVAHSAPADPVTADTHVTHRMTVPQPPPMPAPAPGPQAAPVAPTAPQPVPVMQATPAPVAPRPAPAPQAAVPMAHATPPAPAPAAPAPRPAPMAQTAPAPAPAPAPQPAAFIPPTPAVRPGSLAPNPPRGYVPPSPAATTPSGFRRRRRGQEGAPQQPAPAQQRLAPNPPRRSPAEVQASLQRFRQGVEAGRSQSPDTASPDDYRSRPAHGGDVQ